jgi:FAD/FMN-containing dehydrogenase
MALEGLAEAVSSGSVETRTEILEGYGAGDSDSVRQPAAVAFPRTAEDVSSIVGWAAETATRLIPVSSQGPHRTAVVPSEGYVVVDLSSMNKVVRADRRNRVALVEPGVTFGELDAALARVGLRAMTPLARRKSKSVVAAYLDRVPTLVPRAQWDLSDPLLCIETVMGSGKIFRTGCSAGPGTLEEQWATGQAQKNPMGPSAFDFFRLVQGSRGSMGIVTWASMKCELLPRKHELIMAPAPGLEPLVESVYRIERAKWGEECLILDPVTLERLTGTLAVADWALLVGVAGFDYRPAQRVAHQSKGINSILRDEGVTPVRSLAGMGSSRLFDLVTGESDPYWKASAGGYSEIYFLTTLDRAGSFMKIIEAACGSQGWPRADLGVYLQPQLGGRVANFEVTLFFENNRATEAHSFERRLAEALAAGGAYFSRPSGAWADLAFRDKALLSDTMARTRRLFDPEGILNPDAPCLSGKK